MRNGKPDRQGSLNPVPKRTPTPNLASASTAEPQAPLCVCIHSAMRCLSARLPYRPHMAHPPLTRSGTFRNTRLNISCAKSTDSSIAWPVGTTRTFTCRSRASRIPAMRHAPKYTIPRLNRLGGHLKRVVSLALRDRLTISSLETSFSMTRR